MVRAMEFGEELKQHRDKAGLTGRELAKRLGIEPAALSRFENGLLPSGKSIEKICEELELSGPERIALFVAARKLPPEVETGLLDNPALLSMVIRNIKCASQVRKKGKN